MASQYREVMHPGGWPRMYGDGLWVRLREAWWVLTGKHSLHVAYQRGYDRHIMDDSARRARGGE